MNKKFITSVLVCFAALTIIAGSTYFIGNNKKNGNEIDLKKVEKTTERSTEDKAQAAQNDVETPTAKDRISDIEDTSASNPGDTVDVGSITIEETTAAKVVEENTVEGDGSLNGLSTEANAVIKSLDFTKESSMIWPLEGNILLEYNMDNTVFFSTLNEYKCNPALVIQGEEYSPVVSATKGVVTEMGENDEIGVYLKVAMGNGYEATYGQIINPVVEVGETVEAAQVIACVNEPSRYYEKEGYNLYFAVTKNGKPVDPMKFLTLQD